jgi:hypothetical protein
METETNSQDVIAHAMERIRRDGKTTVQFTEFPPGAGNRVCQRETVTGTIDDNQLLAIIKRYYHILNKHPVALHISRSGDQIMLHLEHDESSACCAKDLREPFEKWLVARRADLDRSDDHADAGQSVFLKAKRRLERCGGFIVSPARYFGVAFRHALTDLHRAQRRADLNGFDLDTVPDRRPFDDRVVAGLAGAESVTALADELLLGGLVTDAIRLLHSRGIGLTDHYYGMLARYKSQLTVKDLMILVSLPERTNRTARPEKREPVSGQVRLAECRARERFRGVRLR